MSKSILGLCILTNHPTERNFLPNMKMRSYGLTTWTSYNEIEKSQLITSESQQMFPDL
jgi:hypothetical protein